MYKITESKRILFFSLQRFFGIGRTTAQRLCRRFGLAPTILSAEIPKARLNALGMYLDKSTEIEGKLRYKYEQNLKKLTVNRSYRGSRLNNGLPARGQRTRTNGRTQKRSIARNNTQKHR